MIDESISAPYFSPREEWMVVSWDTNLCKWLPIGFPVTMLNEYVAKDRYYSYKYMNPGKQYAIIKIETTYTQVETPQEPAPRRLGRPRKGQK